MHARHRVTRRSFGIFAVSACFVAGALVLAAVEPALADPACSRLLALKLPNTTIVSAVSVPEGTISAPPIFGNLPPILAPARCEVEAITRPTRDSEIRLQVWLPASGWNGKYLQLGNGGWAGSVDRTAMADPVRRGYAVAATDDGHASSGPVPSASWAIGHPEKLIDFGYRAVHETSVQAKAVVRAHFGRAAARSYFSGCSDGGREALMEAQRYPEEFDGIIAGAPANNGSHLFTGFVWNEQGTASERWTDAQRKPRRSP
jgi:feruloyl esterase